MFVNKTTYIETENFKQTYNNKNLGWGTNLTFNLTKGSGKDQVRFPVVVKLQDQANFDGGLEQVSWERVPEGLKLSWNQNKDILRGADLTEIRPLIAHYSSESDLADVSFARYDCNTSVSKFCKDKFTSAI